MKNAVTCQCGHCSHQFDVNVRFAGRAWMCPNCAESVVVPNLSPSDDLAQIRPISQSESITRALTYDSANEPAPPDNFGPPAVPDSLGRPDAVLLRTIAETSHSSPPDLDSSERVLPDARLDGTVEGINPEGDSPQIRTEDETTIQLRFADPNPISTAAASVTAAIADHMKHEIPGDEGSTSTRHEGPPEHNGSTATLDVTDGATSDKSVVEQISGLPSDVAEIASSQDRANAAAYPVIHKAIEPIESESRSTYEGKVQQELSSLQALIETGPSPLPAQTSVTSDLQRGQQQATFDITNTAIAAAEPVDAVVAPPLHFEEQRVAPNFASSQPHINSSIEPSDNLPDSAHSADNLHSTRQMAIETTPTASALPPAVPASPNSDLARDQQRDTIDKTIATIAAAAPADALPAIPPRFEELGAVPDSVSPPPSVKGNIEPSGSLPGEVLSADELLSMRRTVVETLKELLPFAADEHKAKNSLLLLTAAQSDAPLQDRLWDDVAYTAGAYCLFMSGKPLTNEQRLGLLDAIVWAFSYCRVYRPSLMKPTLTKLCVFLESTIQSYETQSASRVAKAINLAGGQADRSILRRLLALANKNPDVRSLVHLREPDEPFEPSSSQTEQSVSNDEIVAVIDQITRNLYVLDRKHADTNIRLLETARQNPHRGTPARLATLAHLVGRNVLFRYRRGTKVPDDAIIAASTLARFAANHGTGNSQAESRLNATLLEGISKLQSRATDATTFFKQAESELANMNPQNAARRQSFWDDLLEIASVHLGGMAAAGRYERDDALGWVMAVAEHIEEIKWGRDAVRSFLNEVKKHNVGESVHLERIERHIGHVEDDRSSGALSFLKPSLQEEFGGWVRSSDLERIKTALWDNRQELLRATSRALAHPSFQTISHPVRFGNIPPRTKSRFAAARESVRSNDKARQEAAVNQFAELSGEYAPPEARLFFHEWLAYAKALVRGPHTAAGDWEEIHRQGASFEAAWNLASFYLRQNSPQKALEILTPGVTSLRAPFSHLRFALYCGVQVIESLPEFKDVTNPALVFLMANLCKLPIAQCYLTWLGLLKVVPHDNLIEQSVKLATFQDLEAKPIEILEPSIRPDQEGVDRIDKFRQYLVSNRLEDTWRIWVNDFSERQRDHTRGWTWLAEACEKAKDLEAAERALNRCVHEQIELLERAERARDRGHTIPRGASGAEQRIRYVLPLLFEFYKRQAQAFPPARVKQTFQSYYQRNSLRVLWDAQVPSNTKLISLVRPYMPEGAERKPTEEGDQPGAGLYPNLLQEISEVQNPEGLNSLQARIDIALAGIAGDTVTRQRKELIRTILQETASLSTVAKTSQEMKAALDQLNKRIEAALEFVDKESSLRQLRPVVFACRRAFQTFSVAIEGTPELQVGSYDLSAGLPSDMEDTSLIVEVKNPGPGLVEDAHFSAQTSDGTIVPRGQAVVRELKPNVSEVVGIPIRSRRGEARDSENCRVDVLYKWGVIQDLKVAASVSAPWFKFDDYVRRHGVSGFEIPSPFVFDRALDLKKDDRRLFKGRTNHLEFFRETILKGRPPGSPIYFHGIRRCGKTSLLNKIAEELKTPQFAPLLFDLHGIRSDQQELNEVIYNLVNKKLLDALQNSADWNFGSGLKSIELSQDHKYPLSELESIFKQVREAAGEKQPVILIDEFHLIANAKAAPLLDLIRRIYDLGYVWFIFSGLLRPEPLREACGTTSLLPLQNREVDFLSEEEVAGTVRDPIVESGVNVPDSTVRSLYAYTAGNPNFVAKIAHLALSDLNNEGRNVITPQDIVKVAMELSDDKANFSSTVLSRQVLSDEEVTAAKQLAGATPAKDSAIDLKSALAIVGEKLLGKLTDKCLFRLREGRIEARGLLVLDHLRKLTELGSEKPIATDGRKKIGMFVDLENILTYVPGSNLTPFGEKLMRYAEAQGQVKIALAVADGRNLPGAAHIRMQLENAKFEVSFVPKEIKLKANIADGMLINKITDEVENWDLDRAILVLGDRDYIFCVQSLLKKGVTVRLVGALHRPHIAAEYRTLETDRRQYCLAEGKQESDFIIDDIEAIVRDAAN